MKKKLLSLLGLLVLAAMPTFAADSLPKRVYSSVALLYSQTEDGGQRMRCTTTAFEKTKEGYLFVTAAHCVATDDEQHEKVSVDKTHFYITFDEKGEKLFRPADVVMVGYQHRGDDFAILSVKTDVNIPVIPIGDETQAEIGDDIINVAAPEGLGKQVFHGWITLLKLDRPIVSEDINWSNAMLLQIESGPGSSGSAIVSVKQQAIIAFLVGHYDANVFAVPVSQFKAFRSAVTTGTYKWFKSVE